MQKSCSRCEKLPEGLPETGTLFLCPPLGHTQQSLRKLLQSEGLPCEEPSAGVLTVPLTTGTLGLLGVSLPGALTEAEMRDTRSLVLPRGTLPGLGDLMNMRPLSGLIALVQGNWLVEAMRDERLLTHFHPIVCASDPATVFAYECLLRGEGRDGVLISPGRLFGAARSADLLFHLDRLARLTAIRSAVRHGMTEHVFINFNPSSIYNPAACLQSTIAEVRNTKLRPERVVFEVVESEQVTDVEHLLGILRFYRDAGFKVALDDLGSGYSSLTLLARLKPDFVKLDMELIRGVDCNPYKAQVAGKLLEMAGGLGIETVVEGVETEGEWHWARENGADYIQGFLFARPACPPPLPRVPGAVMATARSE